MPLKQPRFIHVQTLNGDKRGFSVYFYPFDLEVEENSTEKQCDNPEAYVSYSVAMCSREDQFSRRAAREQCYLAEERICRVVDFPAVLASLDARCYNVKFDKLDKKQQRHLSNQFAWVWKYFL